jgi:hypothetical protein
MSEHLLIDLNQLYRLYSVDDVDGDYYSFDFLPSYNSIDSDIIYDVINCLSIYSLNNMINFLYKQWSLLRLDPELNQFPTAKRRKLILLKKFTEDTINSKQEFNEKMSFFIDRDQVFGLYVMNQVLKFLYPCKL